MVEKTSLWVTKAPDGSDNAYCKLFSVLRRLHVLVCFGHDDFTSLTVICQ